ncbi:hypothetical protein ASPWEDRAFT_170040 [Aspergillus wentii DTO 134E9]|uniref:Rhodopsin domain-containing protein n=1 Tax=Aspergillus wentii DTO 134E9 TaxID=1073089 RepID=A0A1L9RNJ8_ASPWE|nr:uncharacterized protein ASPWEDRAFT_170040 [Aspergillus wentii DTO 134E9]KAI9934333.1 hypothetical protein MW887_005410 [Aspergillus wentii]OJJ36525.1 hypothetical protein ASPWEDRAFT_170040 [Aspergillus wentii DTO 134E9]
MVEFKGRSESIFVVTVVFLCISFTAVCLRCFVRLRLMRAFGWDDSLMLFAMAWNILFAICGITGAIYGMGQKFEQILVVNPKNVQTAMFWWWLGQISYVFTVVLAKISIALALLRLTVAKAHSILLWVVIGVSVVIGLVFWFMLTLQCHPVSFFWERTGDGKCISTDILIDIAYLYSVTATLCDFVLGLLPFLLVWNLQMNTKTKAALAGILSMGCVASAAVIVRIPYLHTYKDPEFLYATTQISIWSNVEAGLGITAGSLVTLRPLFRWFRGESYAGTRSARRTAGSFPLSSMERGTKGSKHDPNGTKFWRPDVDPEDSHAVVTTIQTSRGSRNSSQEDLNPRRNSLHGVNVEKTFLVTSDDV